MSFHVDNCLPFDHDDNDIAVESIVTMFDLLVLLDNLCFVHCANAAQMMTQNLRIQQLLLTLAQYLPNNIKAIKRFINSLNKNVLNCKLSLKTAH